MMVSIDDYNNNGKVFALCYIFLYVNYKIYLEFILKDYLWVRDSNNPESSLIISHELLKFCEEVLDLTEERMVFYFIYSDFYNYWKYKVVWYNNLYYLKLLKSTK